jgi:hypothetical protein
MFEDVGTEEMLLKKREQLILKLELATASQKKFGTETKKTTETLKEQDPAIVKINEAIDKMREKYSDVNITINAMNNAFDTMYNSASKNITDVIMRTQTLDQALGNIVKDTLRAIIQGFVQMAIVGPAIRILVELFHRLFNISMDNASAVDKEANAQKRYNDELKRTIVYRSILMLLGVRANGGAVGYANGGAIGYGGARAGGGPVNNSNAFLVGERGPELFVPNSAGTIIPSERLGSSMGDISVNFNISATDATSFDSMLVQRRGLITNIINDALNRQGRRI